MKKILLLSTLVAAASVGLQDVSIGHGGTYRGPGDTVPPGGSGGGDSGPGGSTPNPNGPSAPSPGGPSTPSPGSPGAPGPGNPGQPSTGAIAGGTDLTVWQFWWGFNKAPFLNLKGHIHSMATETGSDDYFLGHGTKVDAKNNRKPSEAVIRDRIVPALKHALATESNNDIVTGALIALAKIGDAATDGNSSEFEALMLPFLNSSSQEIAETAAIALGILGNPRSIGTLTSLLTDDAIGRKLVGSEAGVNYRTRAFAAYGLGQVGSASHSQEDRQTIVNTLWEVCESPRQSTRDVKVAAVIAIGLVPLEEGTASAGNKNEHTGVPRTLQQQVGYLTGFFIAENDKTKHYMVRAHAARSICRLMEKMQGSNREYTKNQVVEALAPYVSKRGNVGKRQLRQSASLAFGILGDLDTDAADEIIRENLMAAAGNTEAQVKNFSVLALGQVGGRPGTGDKPLAGAQEIRAYLQKNLVKGKTLIKPWAGLALGLMERGMAEAKQDRSESSLRALRSSLSDSRTQQEVGAYAIACGIAGDQDAESILLEKLEKMSEDEVRGYIAVGLGLMNSTRAIKPIQDIVEKSKYRSELLKQAAIALGLLGDRKLVPLLIKMLGDAKTLSTRAAIASALGFIGDDRSVEPLLKMLAAPDITDAARGFAAVALGIVADKEDLPWNSKFSVDINYRANTHSLTGGGGTGLLDIL
jgi:HEAT repeat protein